MFGYLFPEKEYLTLPEKKIFRDYFCTLCLGHRYRYGILSTFMNNYDLGIFAIILNLYGEKIETCGKCGKYVENRKEKFTAAKWRNIIDFNINLVRKKLEDDTRDKPNLLSRIKMLGASEIFRKTKKINPDFYYLFDREFEKYLTIEKQKPDLHEILNAYEDFARNTFAAIPEAQQEYTNLFLAINRWIFWIDAIDDYDADKKEGSYNPYFQKYYENKDQFLQNNMLELLEEYKEIKRNIIKSYSLCSYPKQNQIILENIINHTIRKTTRVILENKEMGKKRRLL